jgi:hypothetical protein
MKSIVSVTNICLKANFCAFPTHGCKNEPVGFAVSVCPSIFT